MTSARPARLLPIALAAVFLLGWRDGIAGVAWPFIRADLGQPLAAFGILTAAGGLAFVATSASLGRLTARFGPGRPLLAGSLLATAGLSGYALSPGWWALPVAALAVGAGAGLIDPGLNSHLALNHGPRVMNLWHSVFGVGTTTGPLVFGLLLTAGQGWRADYRLVALLEAGLLIWLWRNRDRWPRVRPETGQTTAPGLDPLLLTGLATFFIYVGLELGAGQWAFSLLSGPRHLPPATAAVLVAVYWGSLTAGRVLLAIAGNRLSPASVIDAGAATGLVGGLLLAWPAAPPAAGLLLLGAGFSGIFPALVLLTPDRFGRSAAAGALGYQAGAGAVGAIVLLPRAGLVFQHWSLELLGPLLAGGSVILMVLGRIGSSGRIRRSFSRAR